MSVINTNISAIKATNSSNSAAKDSMPAGAAVWVCMLVFPGVGPSADGVRG